MPGDVEVADARLGLVAAGPEILVALGEVDQVALARRRIEQAAAELGQRLALALEAPDDLAVLLDRAGALVVPLRAGDGWSRRRAARRRGRRPRSSAASVACVVMRHLGVQAEERARALGSGSSRASDGSSTSRVRQARRARSPAARRRTGRPSRPSPGRRRRGRPASAARRARTSACRTTTPGPPSYGDGLRSARAGSVSQNACHARQVQSEACRRRGWRRGAARGSARRSRWPASAATQVPISGGKFTAADIGGSATQLPVRRVERVHEHAQACVGRGLGRTAGTPAIRC